MKKIGLLLASLVATAMPTQALVGYVPDNCCQPCWGLEVYGDYLYWKVTEDQLQYAAQVGAAAFTTPDTTGGALAVIDLFAAHASVNLVEPDFDYNSGFRVGLAYNFGCCSNWSINAEYTRLHFTRNSSVAGTFGGAETGTGASGVEFVYPVLMPAASIVAGITSGGDSIFPLAAANEFRFRYDTVDLQLGVTKNCGCFSARPYIGGKGAWIRQNHDTAYLGLFGFESEPTETTFPIFAAVARKNDFKAGGLEIGVDSALKFWGNLALVSGFQGALLYGRFDTTSTEAIVITTANPAVDFASVSVDLQRYKRNNRLRPMVDAYIGLGWDTCFCGKWLFNIGAAWELQYWWNQWQATSTIEEVVFNFGNAPQGDLMLQGLTVFASITF